MSYLDEVIAKVSEKNANEPEFLQTVEEVLSSLRPVVEKMKKSTERLHCWKECVNRKERLNSE